MHEKEQWEKFPSQSSLEHVNIVANTLVAIFNHSCWILLFHYDIPSNEIQQTVAGGQ